MLSGLVGDMPLLVGLFLDFWLATHIKKYACYIACVLEDRHVWTIVLSWFNAAS
jgi:hypothetical protein